MSRNKQPHTLEVTLLMAIVDQLRILTWMQTKDAQNGKNRPKMLLETSQESKKAEEIETYSTGAEFMEARKKWMGGG